MAEQYYAEKKYSNAIKITDSFPQAKALNHLKKDMIAKKLKIATPKIPVIRNISINMLCAVWISGSEYLEPTKKWSQKFSPAYL